MWEGDKGRVGGRASRQRGHFLDASGRRHRACFNSIRWNKGVVSVVANALRVSGRGAAGQGGACVGCASAKEWGEGGPATVARPRKSVGKRMLCEASSRQGRGSGKPQPRPALCASVHTYMPS